MNFKRNERDLKQIRGKQINVIGITGGIGSGKTVATDALRAAGFTVIDADEISRAMFARGTDGERAVLRLFPQAESNGTLDRAALRAVIATDASQRMRLNEYTHPLIMREIRTQISACAPPVVLSAPLLFESALARLCDATVCVYCPRNKRAERIAQRDGITITAAQAMIDTQIPDTERAALSDFIVPSDVPPDQFKAEIIELFNEITAVNGTTRTRV